MSKHFRCTACGKCCYGQLPLTWQDALTHAERFPLGIVWTPIQPGSRDFKLVGELGAIIKIRGQKEIATLIVPTSFIPSTFACPALMDDNLCGIHRDKPSRCKTMPFYPYREERFQAEVLTPRLDWKCDTSTAAPLVFEDRKIIAREDFDRERSELISQAPILRRYAEYMQKYSHTLIQNLTLASSKPGGGQIVTSLSSFLTATQFPEAKQLARKQLQVLNQYIEKTVDISQFKEFHANYVNWAKEMTYLAR